MRIDRNMVTIFALIGMFIAGVCLWRGASCPEGRSGVVDAACAVIASDVRVDPSVADRGVVSARTDGSVRSATERDLAMSRFMNSGGLSREYGELMRTLHADGARDELMRNFAIQHLGHYARERHRRGVYDPRSREAEEIRTTLASAIRETSTTVAAPAFRALADLAVFDPEVDTHDFDERLTACIADSSAALPARVMAVQICGERRLASARGRLVALRTDGKTPVPLSLAAGRSLGLIAGEEITE